MSTALSTNVKTVDYPSLSPNSRQAQIILANLDGEPMAEQDLIRVPTPAGGGVTWNIDANGNVETTDEIEGLLVCIGKRGVLWPKDDPSEMRPVIVSNDLLVGYRVSDDLGSIDPKALEKYRIGDRRYDWAALSSSPRSLAAVPRLAAALMSPPAAALDINPYRTPSAPKSANN